MVKNSGPLNGPLAQAIDRHMLSLGGSPLRHRMENGKAQFWVSLSGRVMAATNLSRLAEMLGIAQEPKMEAAVEAPKDLISISRAATLTGYSTNPILSAVHSNKLKGYKLGSRRVAVSRAAVEQWAAEHRAMGGIYLPRRRRKHVNGAAPKPKMIHAGSDSGKGFYPSADVHKRMMTVLERFKGTPMEITAQDFVTKVVSQALDRMEK